MEHGRWEASRARPGLIRRHGLIEPGGEVTCLVSGGADSTCLWHVLRELGYRVSALHVNHGLRGVESEEDARFCREAFGAEVVDAPPARTEDELRELRYSFADRPAARHRSHRLGPGRDRPLPPRLQRPARCRDQSEARGRRSSGPCSSSGARTTERVLRRRRACRTARDSSNEATKRGLIRDRRSCRCSRSSIRAPARTCSRSRPRRTSRACRARSSGRCRRCSPAPTARRRPTSATASARCASTTACRWSTGRCASARGRSRRTCPGSRCAPGAQVTASAAAARRCRTSSSTRRCPGASVRPGRSSSTEARLSACPGSWKIQAVEWERR